MFSFTFGVVPLGEVFQILVKFISDNLFGLQAAYLDQQHSVKTDQSSMMLMVSMGNKKFIG